MSTIFKEAKSYLESFQVLVELTIFLTITLFKTTQNMSVMKHLI